MFSLSCHLLSKPRFRLTLLLLLCFLVSNVSAAPYKVLVFSATAGFRHDSITNGLATIQALGVTNGFTVDATEDATKFNDANLAQYKAVIFLCTTGEVLTNSTQEAALQHFIEAGGGWVGIHSAADTEYSWAWYGGLMGAYFLSHPAIQQATVKVPDRVDPSTKILPKRWVRTDEWYNFQTNPRGAVHVLATLDESTYAGGSNGFDHPISWSHNYDGGRAWYTGMGHTPESYNEPLFQAHLLGGIQFAAGVVQADPGSTIDSNFQKVILDSTAADPLELSIAADGRVFYIERGGNVKIYKPSTASIVLAGHVNVETLIEDGLLGIALDNGFATNNWLYLFYSPAGTNSEQHISRFTMNGDVLDMSSEKVLLVIPTQRQECCHSAGSLFMHTNGDLYISVGDNTNPFDSNGFAPLDEQSGRSPWDSQKSASNANDLRGKILRIHPELNGTYTIPAGNLFAPGTPLTRPEIYVMGCRNPFRMAVDEGTGWLYWGEVGPDASADVASRGPKGYDEWNQARAAGNFGWPYFVANNNPYIDYDFATGISGAAFNPASPKNNSPNNTGITNLPPAQPAWIWYPYDNSAEFPEVNGSGRTAMGGPVYHFRTNVLTATKLPTYFDQSLFIWEWSRNFIKEVKLDDDGSVLKISPFLPSLTFNRPIDLKIGPDGVIYMIEWGTGFGGGNPDAKVIRIDYTGGTHAPVAIGTATPDNGPVPLTVQFSSAGTYDPDTNDVVNIAWSFFGNGVTNATGATAGFTYTNAGDYEAKLMVTDLAGNLTVANIPVHVGNTRPAVNILQPPNGAIFDWGKSMAYQLSVFDAEDGSTTNGSIACSNVIAAPSLGHNDHSHGQGQFNGCSGVFTAPENTDSDADNLFMVLNASYTDRAAASVNPLSATATYVFQPRRKQAEFCATNGSVRIGLTADPAGGGFDVININHGSSISLNPVNLTGITGIVFRAASRGLGGRIELHIDSSTGPLLGTAYIPFTSGNYSNYTAAISNPGGSHTLYFVFLGNPGDANLFVLNWFEFQGVGLSLAPSPFMAPISLPGAIQAENFDNGGEGVAYHDTDPVNSGGAYRSEGVDIQSSTNGGIIYNLTQTIAGEWLKYSVNVATAGRYTLNVRFATQAPGGTFHIEFNGINKTGPIVLPNTFGGQSWQTLVVTNILLDAGAQTVKVVMDTNSSLVVVGNLDYFQFVVSQANIPPTVSLTAPGDQANFSAPAMVTVSASAVDSDGSISKVDFFEDNFLIGTATNTPYSVTWSNVPAGNYILRARATDNIGNATDSASRTIRIINGETPAFGFPQVIPGIIQAEDFDNGGEGIAFHDTDTGNNGGKYRTTAVDIETTGDVGGGYNVGWTAGGEWLNYSVRALVDGLYSVRFRIASSGDGGPFHLEVDGVNKTGSISNLSTGGWQTYRDVVIPNVGITAGLHTLRLAMESSGPNGAVGNYNYMEFVATRTNPPPTLAHRYRFNESPGTSVAQDSVGTANGNLLSGAFFTGNGELNFPGTSGYLNLPNGLISPLTNVTMEAWLTWNSGGNWQRIFDFGNNSNGENNQGTGLTYFILTPRSGAGVLRFAVSTNSGGGEVGTVWTNALPTNQLTHTALAYDYVAGSAMLYLNGQRIAVGAAPIPLSAIIDVNDWLGRSNWPDPYFNGSLNEFRIYDGVLGDNEVAASFAAGPDALLGARPTLNVTRSGANLLFSWPDGSGYGLEQNANLSAIGWTAVTNTPLSQNGTAIVTLPPTASAQFFRLKR